MSSATTSGTHQSGPPNNDDSLQPTTTTTTPPPPPTPTPLPSSSTDQQQQQQQQQQQLQRARWSQSMEEALLTHLQNSQFSVPTMPGKRKPGPIPDTTIINSNSFNQKTWEDAIPIISAALPKDYKGPPITSKIIQDKWENMKKSYRDYVMLKSRPDLGWDEATQTPTCSHEVWIAFVLAHPNMKRFYNKGLRYYERMAQLQENSGIGIVGGNSSSKVAEGITTTAAATSTGGVTPTGGEYTRSGGRKRAAPPPPLIGPSHPSVSEEPTPIPDSTALPVLPSTPYLRPSPSFTSHIISSPRTTPIPTAASISRTISTILPAPTTIITPAPSTSTPQTMLRATEIPDRPLKRQRSRQDDLKTGAVKALADALDRVADVTEAQMRFHKPGIRELAIAKLQSDFPNLDVRDFLIALNLFEESLKCEIFVALQDKQIAKEWLKQEFRKKNHIPTSQVFFIWSNNNQSTSQEQPQSAQIASHFNDTVPVEMNESGGGGAGGGADSSVASGFRVSAIASVSAASASIRDIAKGSGDGTSTGEEDEEDQARQYSLVPRSSEREEQQIFR